MEAELTALLVTRLREDPAFMTDLQCLTVEQFRDMAGPLCGETGNHLTDALQAILLEGLETLFHGTKDTPQ